MVAVAPHVFARVAYGERSSGLVAVAETPAATLAGLQLPAAPLVAVVEGCEKPGNLGAVLRSADGAGLSAVIATDSVTDLFNPNTIRTSLGTLFTLPVAAASAEETLAYLRQQRLQIVAVLLTLGAITRRSITSSRQRSSWGARPRDCRTAGAARTYGRATADARSRR